MKNSNRISHTGKRVISIVTILFFTLITTSYASNPEENTYPTSERLFHIARSTNKNLVCYDVNLENGKLNTKTPLNVYWVNREERPGETNGLSYFQRKMAYGYKLVSEGDDFSEVTLTAYSGKKLKICKLNSKYVCMTTIDNQPAILESLYVQTKSGSPLSVEYVELQGISTSTGTKVSERVKK